MTSSVGSVIVRCQSCWSPDLRPFLNLGWLPPVNTFRKVGTRPEAEVRWPAELLHCPACSLVQMGFVPPPEQVFPKDYAYRSGTTKALRDNFKELVQEVVEAGYAEARLPTDGPSDLVVDIGCNDGTLLQEFEDCGLRVAGVDPAYAAATEARFKGISVVDGSFTKELAEKYFGKNNQAKVVTACNVFAHTPDPNDFVEGVKAILADDGVFVVEVQNVFYMIEQTLFDTVYHEHLRYYGLTSLRKLFERHGMEIVRFKETPTHGGSLRVHAARKGKFDPVPSVYLDYYHSFEGFANNVRWVRQSLIGCLTTMGNTKVYGVGCPSRAVTLINYCGLEAFLDRVCEVPDSPKVGCYVPGTRIPVVDEAELFRDQPRYALLLSWHLADELIPKLKAGGFKGQFIVPLPRPRIV